MYMINLFLNKNNKKIYTQRETEDVNPNLLTLSTCWYTLKSKFNVDTYLEWIRNFLSIVNNFNLVIYTDNKSITYLLPFINNHDAKIKIIIKEMNQFYTYKYKNNWILNNANSELTLHKKTDWKLNMLWNEKVFFVNETIQKRYFNTMYYGWCDIGYFRDRSNDLHTRYLHHWPNPRKLLSSSFNNMLIHYGCVQNDQIVYNDLKLDIKQHYNENLPRHPTNKINEICFAGGFFILKPDLINEYATIYNEKLLYYFTNRYVIKDDQTIIMDIIFTNPELFYIHNECDKRFDNWFMFQRFLV